LSPVLFCVYFDGLLHKLIDAGYGCYIGHVFAGVLGPDLQRILRQTYDSAALTPDLRRACDLRAIDKKS